MSNWEEGHSEQQILQFMAKTVAEATGRDIEYSNDAESRKADNRAKNKEFYLARPTEYTTTSSSKDYQDINSPFTQREIGIGGLSKEDAKQSVTQRTSYALTTPTTAMYGQHTDSPFTQVYANTERTIGNIAGAISDPVKTPGMSQIGSNGTGNEPHSTIGMSPEAAMGKTDENQARLDYGE